MRQWVVALVCLAFMVSNIVVLVAGQGIGAQQTPTPFMENYVSQSDLQHFRVLNNGMQVQLVLDEYSGDSTLHSNSHVPCLYLT